MKKLSLQTELYRVLEKSYGEWLLLLGYSEQTGRSFPSQVREFLHWLEGNGVLLIGDWSMEIVNKFMEYFSQRPNQKRGGGLSNSHINKQRYAMNLLFKYLSLTDQLGEKLELCYVAKDEVKVPLLLSKEEVGRLYKSCGQDALGQRDRAMLSIYYGCGLRRSEGVNLALSDVLFDRHLLHVRKSKNSWDRYIPMVLGVRQDLERYIYGGRKLLCGGDSGDHLFLTDRGKVLCGQSLMRRLKKLLAVSELPNEIGLHSLRHSIATHLLESGMSLEEVSLFLGHRVLDSSQRYTHIKELVWKNH